MNRSTIAFLVSLASITAIGLIVFAAISAGALVWLILGILAISLIMRYILAETIERITNSRYKMIELNYNHIERVMKLGYQPNRAGYVMLPAPQIDYEPDIPVSIAGVSPQALTEYRTDAENLVALSKQLILQGIVKDKQQIAPYNQARKVDYFRDVAIWMNAVRYLMANQMAEERKRGNKHLGTFCIAGTVEQLYQRLRQK